MPFSVVILMEKVPAVVERRRKQRGSRVVQTELNIRG